MSQIVQHQKVNLRTRIHFPFITNSQKTKKVQIFKAQLKTHAIKKIKRISSENVSKQRIFSRLLSDSNQSIFDEKNFTCPICLEILISPIIFQCGHFGCLKCIQTVSAYQNRCFLCRKVFENFEYKPSNVISAIIQRNILKNIDNPIEHYTRLADHFQWQKKKELKINDVEIGSFVDVRCVESGKWKNGIILSIENFSVSKFNLLIRYKHEKGNIEELIDISSSRLAKLGFYTQKRAVQSSDDHLEEIEADIPEISTDFFENIPMDRNPFFVGRKEENIFSESFEIEDEVFMGQKTITPQSSNPQMDFDSFEYALEQFLNPQRKNDFLDSELLEVSF